MDAFHRLALFTAGLTAGFVDAIAGGGGMITVPALLWAGLPPQAALGTNKFQSCFGTAVAVTRYARAGLMRWTDVRVIVMMSAVAAVAGAWCVGRMDSDFLRRLIPWMLLGVGLYTLFNPRLGEGAGRARVNPTGFAWLAGAALGFYDGFFGPGTGSFWTLALVGLLGLDLRAATARTKAANLASNLGSLVVFANAGQVRMEAGLFMIAGQLIGSWLGAHVVIRGGVRVIRAVFLTVVFALTLKLLLSP